MYALKSARLPEADYAGPRGDAPGGPGERAFSELPAVLYLDPRAFTRDCIGGWLRNSLNGFEVCVMSDPEQIETMAIAGDRVRAVIINADPERLFSATVARLLTRVRELLPEIPLAVVSDHEDAESIQEGFQLGVRGYIPTSLASKVAIGAVHLVCIGGTFAPAAALLCQSDRQPRPAGNADDRGLHPTSGADSGLPAPRYG
jgi:DNA-binding NarL/FixJ family response regulator